MIDAAEERGQSTVEIALLLPVIALVLAAVVEVGLLVADQGRLWHAAREAVRVAAVDDDETQVEAAAERVGLAPLEITIRPDAVRRRQGESVTVTVVYRPGGRVPLLGRLFQRASLEAEATMRIEQP